MLRAIWWKHEYAHNFRLDSVIDKYSNSGVISASRTKLMNNKSRGDLWWVSRTLDFSKHKNGLDLGVKLAVEIMASTGQKQQCTTSSTFNRGRCSYWRWELPPRRCIVHALGRHTRNCSLYHGNHLPISLSFKVKYTTLSFLKAKPSIFLHVSAETSLDCTTLDLEKIGLGFLYVAAWSLPLH